MEEDNVVRELDEMIENVQKQQQIDELERFNKLSKIKNSNTTSSPTYKQPNVGTWPKYHRINEALTTTPALIPEKNHATVSGSHHSTLSSARKTILANDLFNHGTPTTEFDENEENIHHKMFLNDRNSKPIELVPLTKSNTPRKESNEEKLPSPGEIRNINIEKNDDVLGINIIENASGGGVYVSNVINNSLASKAGIHVGDQLLEINGVNLRKAGYKEAAKILTDLGSHNYVINLLVQFNPAKYLNSNKNDSIAVSDILSSTGSTTPTPLAMQPSPARCVLLKRSLSNLGLKICGGNQIGIFIDNILTDCSLQKGDQILEWNNQDIRNFTLEKATWEIFKKNIASNNIKINVQFNLKSYEQVNQEEGNDSFFIICLNDREKKREHELKLKKFDLLHVRNTLPLNAEGYWQAVLVTDSNNTKCGFIPSMKRFVSELCEQHENVSNDDESQTDTSLSMSSTPTAPSTSKLKKASLFFKAKQQKIVNPVNETQQQHFIDLSAIIKSFVNEELRQHPLTYKLVECIDLNQKRPCLIFGEFADFLIDYIVQLNDDTMKFTKIHRQTTNKQSLQFDLNELEFGLYDYVSLDDIKECLFKLNQFAFIKIKNFDNLKELRFKHRIYPIVIYLKYKSIKQLQHMNNTLANVLSSSSDNHCDGPKKINHKTAKELFLNTSKVEKEYKNYITNYCDLGQIQNDINNVSSSTNGNSTMDFVDVDFLKQVYELIKNIVSVEQNRMIWVPVSNELNNNIFV